MQNQNSLLERCHVNQNTEGDRFVGVKSTPTGPVICFPLGYQLPEGDDALRSDIILLLSLLYSFMKEDQSLDGAVPSMPEKAVFPMHAYLTVIRNYLRTGHYYVETDPHYKTDVKGRVSWPRTFCRQKALLQQNGSLVFTNMTVRSNAPNADKKITQLHKHCVYEAFEKMGWLYVSYLPEKPSSYPSYPESLYLLAQKLASTHNDAEQSLFFAMRDMLTYMDDPSFGKEYCYGTEHFEHLWEKMIDKAFGIPDKDQYFPRAKWVLDYGSQRVKSPLQPDSIMLYHGKVYVLDAKLYRFGCNPDKPELLPNSSDINKQITYGEYIANTKGVDTNNLYNAFIMPFNCAKNSFYMQDSQGNFVPGFTGPIGNVAEAIGDWRTNKRKYEHVQGIVVDTRFLMRNYAAMSDHGKQLLADAIEKVDQRESII